MLSKFAAAVPPPRSSQSPCSGSAAPRYPSVQSSGVYEDLCSDDLQLFTFSHQVVWFLLKIYRRFNILLLPVLKHHDSFIIWKRFQPSQLDGGLHTNPAHPRLPARAAAEVSELPAMLEPCHPPGSLKYYFSHISIVSSH